MKTSDIHKRCDEITSLLRHNGGAYRRCRAHRYATSHNSAYATFLDLKTSVLSLETIASGAAVRRHLFYQIAFHENFVQ